MYGHANFSYQVKTMSFNIQPLKNWVAKHLNQPYTSDIEELGRHLSTQKNLVFTMRYPIKSYGDPTRVNYLPRVK